MARILFVSDTPLTAGQEWELTKMCGEAGIYTDAFFVTSLFKYETRVEEMIALRRKKDMGTERVLLNGAWVDPAVGEAYEKLKQEFAAHFPNIIVPLGNATLLCLTGERSVDTYRGSEMTTENGFKVIPTLHPGTITKQWNLRAVAVTDLRRIARESLDPGVTVVQRTFILSPVIQDIRHTFDKLEKLLEAGPLKLAVDIECHAFSIACLGIAWSTTAAICIPFIAKDRHYWNLADEIEVVSRLITLFRHPNAQIVGQNFIFDAQYIHRSFHVIPRLERDTMTMQHVCFPGMQKSLDFLASMYCEHYTFWKLDGKDWEKGVDEMTLWHYNCLDCCYTYEVDAALVKVVEALGLREQNEFQQSLFYPVLNTMVKGVRYNDAARKELIKELKKAKEDTQSWLDDIAGHPLSVSSPKQMQAFFYEELGLAPQKKRGTGKVSTDRESLDKLALKEPLIAPVVKKIDELRSISVFLATFLGEKKGRFIRHFLDSDHRIRCSYNTAGTVTYRFSSSTSAFGHGLNLQNIPTGDD